MPDSKLFPEDMNLPQNKDIIRLMFFIQYSQMIFPFVEILHSPYRDFNYSWNSFSMLFFEVRNPNQVNILFSDGAFQSGEISP